jgi:hypothetical protein
MDEPLPAGVAAGDWYVRSFHNKNSQHERATVKTTKIVAATAATRLQQKAVLGCRGVALDALHLQIPPLRLGPFAGKEPAESPAEMPDEGRTRPPRRLISPKPKIEMVRVSTFFGQLSDAFQ